MATLHSGNVPLLPSALSLAHIWAFAQVQPGLSFTRTLGFSAKLVSFPRTFDAW